MLAESCMGVSETHGHKRERVLDSFFLHPNNQSNGVLAGEKGERKSKVPKGRGGGRLVEQKQPGVL